MKYIKLFESYLSDLILESTLSYSEEFLNVLNNLDSNISKSLIELNNRSFDKNNITFIDLKDQDTIYYRIETKVGGERPAIRRQESKIGRILTKLLELSGEKFTSSEKEDFINKFKAISSFSKDAFKIYKGDDIYQFYNMIDYDKENGVGQLGKSCMNRKPDEFFHLYTKNPSKVNLIVLERDGEMVGRCLLWETDNGFKFMDRIYTYMDSDIDLFKMYGDSKGYWYKEVQNTSYRNRFNFNYKFNIKNRNEIKSEDIVVSLENYDVDYFPYLDSLCYFNTYDGRLSNSRFKIDADLLVCNIDGGYKSSDFQWSFD